MNGCGEGRGVAQIQVLIVLQLCAHGDAQYAQINNLIHRARAQHLNPQQLIGGSVSNQLDNKVSGIRIVMGLIIRDHQHSFHVKALLPGSFLRQAGFAHIKAGQLADSSTQHPGKGILPAGYCP